MTTIQAAAIQLGVTERTIERYVAAGQLSKLHVGKGKRPMVRLYADEVDALVRPVNRRATTRLAKERAVKW